MFLRFHPSIPAIGALALMWLASAASAQTSYPTVEIAAGGGVANGSADTHGTVGATASVELSDRVAVEGAFDYFERGPATSAFALTGNLRFNLLTGRRVTPFVVGGGGLYHTDFDLDDPRYLGPVGANARAGSLYCTGMQGRTGPGFGAPSWAGTGTCPAGAAGYWAVGDLPNFYARRLGTLTVPAGGQWGHRTFTDPAVTVGGGLTVHLTDHWALRPEGRALIVFRNSHSHALGVYGVSLGYRF